MIVFGFENVQLFGVADVHRVIEPVPIQASTMPCILYGLAGWLEVDSPLFAISLDDKQAADQ